MIDGVTSVDVIAVGEDRAAVRWTLGLPGDEEITGVSILELDDGLISAETVYYDSRAGTLEIRLQGHFLATTFTSASSPTPPVPSLIAGRGAHHDLPTPAGSAARIPANCAASGGRSWAHNHGPEGSRGSLRETEEHQPVERMFIDRICPGQRPSHSGSGGPSCLTRASPVRHEPESSALRS